MFLYWALSGLDFVRFLIYASKLQRALCMVSHRLGSCAWPPGSLGSCRKACSVTVSVRSVCFHVVAANAIWLLIHHIVFDNLVVVHQ